MVAVKRTDLPAGERLKVHEIFFSIQGEASTAGWPTVFVRLTGCPLRCRYCDTEYAFYGGEWRSFDEILDEVGRYAPRYVCVTGGEPLAQQNCATLLERLCDAGYRVSVETSGAYPVEPLDARVQRVMDIKTPGSGEVERNLALNLEHLRADDVAKYVICDRADYEWARAHLREHDLPARCEVLFSPSFGQQSATELAEWVLEDRLPVRVQVQLHKVLWGEEPGR